MQVISKTLKILYLNIRSLKCHHDALAVSVSSLVERPHIIALNETWLDPADNTKHFSIEGFQNNFATRKDRRWYCNNRRGGYRFLKNWCDELKHHWSRNHVIRKKQNFFS